MKLNVKGLIHENSARNGPVSEDTISKDISDSKPLPFPLGTTRLLTPAQLLENSAFSALLYDSNDKPAPATTVSHQNGVVHIQGSEAWQVDSLPAVGYSFGFEVVAGALGMVLACFGSWLRSFNARPHYHPRYQADPLYRGGRENKTRSLFKRTLLEEAKQKVELEADFDMRSKADWLTDLFSRHQLVAIGNRLLSDLAVKQSAQQSAKQSAQQSAKQSDRQSAPLSDDSDEPNLALLCINVNRFSDINAQWGYEAGDELLRRLASRLRAALRSRLASVALARMGSDEFALLLTDTDEADIHQVHKGVLQALNQPVEFQSQSIAASCRIGVAQSKASELGCFSELIAQATVAMREGRAARQASSACPQAPACPQADVQGIEPRIWDESRLVFLKPYVEGLTQTLPRSLPRSLPQFLPRSQYVFSPSLEQSIKHAIAQNQLQIHYQPIVDLRSARSIKPCQAQAKNPHGDSDLHTEQNATTITRFKTVGFEALIRWQHPELGLLQPVQFLPVAKRIGLAFEIDRWVMKTVCQQLSAWRPATPTVNVNLFANHLMQPDLVSFIQQLLERYPISPHQLNLEVTEGELIEDLNEAADSLHKIRALGLGISLDDFGSGYSSLSYLDQLPTDVLKIDQSFIQRMSKPHATAGAAASCSSRVIVEAVLELAEKLNVRVVAEGIEGVDQLELLKAMRCRYGQGYLFSRPVTAQSAEALLHVG